jgi:hypothetical protein
MNYQIAHLIFTAIAIATSLYNCAAGRKAIAGSAGAFVLQFIFIVCWIWVTYNTGAWSLIFR